MRFQALSYPKISLNLGKNHLISYLDVLVECLLNGGIVGVDKLTLRNKSKFSSEFTNSQPPAQTGLPTNFCRPSGNPWEQLCAASFAPSLSPLTQMFFCCLFDVAASKTSWFLRWHLSQKWVNRWLESNSFSQKYLRAIFTVNCSKYHHSNSIFFFDNKRTKMEVIWRRSWEMFSWHIQRLPRNTSRLVSALDLAAKTSVHSRDGRGSYFFHGAGRGGEG